jgi:hypothetical protein
MGKLLCCLSLLFWWVIGGCRGTESQVASKTRGGGESVENSFIVELCLGMDELSGISSFLRQEEHFHHLLNQKFTDSRIKTISFLSSFPHRLRFRSLKSKQNCSLSMLSQMDFYSEKEGEILLSTWQRSGKVEFWEPNWLNTLSEVPRDSLFMQYAEGRRWWMEDVRLLSALEDVDRLTLSAGGPHTPVIAVLDGGIDYTHPSLKGRIWENNNHSNVFCLNDRWGCNTVDAPHGYLGNGEVHPFGTEYAGQSCHGYRIRKGDCMHATHIAGLLVGRVETGIPGICPFCKIMNLKVLESIDGEGRISDAAVLRALRYLSLFERGEGKNLVQIVSLSFGKYQKGKALALYIEYLSTLRDGILFVAAAGNEDSQRRVFPAALPSVIAVTALAASGRKASYSNYGSWVDIAAPGGEVREGAHLTIASSVPGGGSFPSQGTSMATPILAGVAGLVLSLKPNLSAHELRNVLLSSADENLYSSDFGQGYNYRNYYPSIDGESVPLLGVGRVDASAAVLGIKKRETDVRKNRRTEIKCAALTGTDASRWDSRWFLFLLPILVVFFPIESSIERKGTREKPKRT